MYAYLAGLWYHADALRDMTCKQGAMLFNENYLNIVVSAKYKSQAWRLLLTGKLFTVIARATHY